MPLTKMELEQIETALEMAAISNGREEHIEFGKIKKLLSKYVGADPPPAPEQKTAADFMGTKYNGPGCFVCMGKPSPSPCRSCGFDPVTGQKGIKKSTTPQTGETGRQEWLQEATATRMVEVVDSSGESSWLNVAEDSLDPARGRPIIAGRVYDYVEGRLVENFTETAKMVETASSKRIILS